MTTARPNPSVLDFVPGELLLSLHRHAPAAESFLAQLREGGIPGVSYVEDLVSRIKGVEAVPNDALEDFTFHRVEVAPGEEVWKINYLHFFYAMTLLDRPPEGEGRSNEHLQVSLNSYLRAGSPVGGSNFSFHSDHSSYLSMLGLSGHATGRGRMVKIVDSGVDPAMSLNIVDRHNFTDSIQPKSVDDDLGHGTAVTAIIDNVVPHADLVIHKVVDRNRFATEWDFLASLGSAPAGDVINLSVVFGLQAATCARCGRLSHSSRSAVFENMLLQQVTAGAIIVACAGNDGLTDLTYPAKFADVVATVAIDSRHNLASFSNHSDRDETGQQHRNVFALPGGQKSGNSITEHVGSDGRETFYGTSLAAAYASGLIASLWSHSNWSSCLRQQVLNRLRQTADQQSFSSYSSSDFGNGRMTYMP